MENPIPYLQLFIIIQCILLLAYLSLNERLSLTSNKILAALMAVLSIHMVVNILVQHIFTDLPPSLGIGLGFCYGPIFYFYAKSLAFQKFQFERTDLMHVIPFVVAQALAITTNISAITFAIGIFISLFGYALGTWKHLREYRYVLSQTRSDYDQITLNWLSNLLVLQLSLLVLNIISVGLYSSGYMIAGLITEIALFCGLWLLVSMMIFQGLQHPTLFAGISDEDQQVADSAQQGEPKAIQPELEEYMDIIEQHMQDNAPYLNPGLTLKSLGRQTTIIPKNISQAINSVAGKNFSEYVNHYRIQHACKLLTSAENEELTVMDVMLESGFITKSNFNRAFKAHTGMTPFEFKQKKPINA